MPHWKELISLINEITDDEKIIVITPLPLPLPSSTSLPSISSTLSQSNTFSSSSTATPSTTLPVSTANLTVLAVKTEDEYETIPADLELNSESEFTLVTSKVKIIPSKTVSKPVTSNKKGKNNGIKNGNLNLKENGDSIGKQNKSRIIEKKSSTKLSDPRPVPVPAPLLVTVPAVSTVVKISTLQQSTFVSPVTSVTPDTYMRELFDSFQTKMSINRSNSSKSNCNNNYNYDNYNNNSNNSDSNSNSNGRNRIDSNSNNSVRANSSDPVQFAAEVAASGARTTVIGTMLTVTVTSIPTLPLTPTILPIPTCIPTPSLTLFPTFSITLTLILTLSLTIILIFFYQFHSNVL